MTANLAYERLQAEMDEAEEKVGRYKFQMFGYWAAIWVHLNRISGFRRPSLWRDLVVLARDRNSTEKKHGET